MRSKWRTKDLPVTSTEIMTSLDSHFTTWKAFSLKSQLRTEPKASFVTGNNKEYVSLDYPMMRCRERMCC